jgi:hypothetical protein
MWLTDRIQRSLLRKINARLLVDSFASNRKAADSMAGLGVTRQPSKLDFRGRVLRKDWQGPGRRPKVGLPVKTEKMGWPKGDERQHPTPKLTEHCTKIVERFCYGSASMKLHRRVLWDPCMARARAL